MKPTHKKCPCPVSLFIGVDKNLNWIVYVRQRYTCMKIDSAGVVLKNNQNLLFLFSCVIVNKQKKKRKKDTTINKMRKELKGKFFF